MQLSMRVGVYLRYPFHAKIFNSTLAALSGQQECLVTAEPRELMRFRPHVVLAAEDISYLHLRGHLPRSLFVHTRHGLASKGIPERSFRAADYVCVTSEFVRDEFVHRGIRPRKGYWTVGYIQMDNLRTAARPPEVPKGRRMILYTPTWHEKLSSLPMFGSRLVELLKSRAQGAVIAIKPHPLVQQRNDPATAPWMEVIRNACRNHPDVILLEDRSTDVMPWLNAADLLVTDASSVQLEFLALNRPMVLINNPRRFSSDHFDSHGYEWAWRDMGLAVDSIDEVPAAIERALNDPSVAESARAIYRERLFGNTLDGRSGERLAARVAALQGQAASETALRAVSPFGAIFYHCLPHLRNLAYAFRRLRSV